MAHYSYNWSARQFNVVRIRGDQFLKFLFSHHLFKRNEGDVITKPTSEFDSHVVVEGLIDGCKHAALQQQTYDILGFDAEFLREFLNGRTLDDAHRFKFSRN